MAERPYQMEHSGKTLFVASDIGEDLLGAAYLRTKQEGMLGMMFWLSAPTLSGFLKWACQRPDVVVIGAFVDRGNGAELAGLGWVREIVTRNGRKYADVGELFFREFQALGVTRDLAELMLDFAFQQVGVSALYGYTPRPNAAAIRFMRGMGFEHTCEIPEAASWMGENCAAVISWMTLGMWQARRQRAGGSSAAQPAA